jgi:hypothetical protein
MMPAKDRETHDYDPPKDFHLPPEGSRDYVAGQPVDEAELKKVDDEAAKKREAAKKAAEEAAAKSKAKTAGEEPHKAPPPPANTSKK